MPCCLEWSPVPRKNSPVLSAYHIQWQVVLGGDFDAHIPFFSFLALALGDGDRVPSACLATLWFLGVWNSPFFFGSILPKYRVIPCAQREDVGDTIFPEKYPKSAYTFPPVRDSSSISEAINSKIRLN
jgi:hypothetical protein